MGKKGGQVISAAVDWETYLKKFEKVPREKLLGSIAGILIQGAQPVNEKDPEQVYRFIEPGSVHQNNYNSVDEHTGVSAMLNAERATLNAKYQMTALRRLFAFGV